jgi:D-alanine-D-alanine ligase
VYGVYFFLIPHSLFVIRISYFVSFLYTYTMTLLYAPNKTVRVGVLRGGPSHEYDVSLKTGAHVLEHMPDPYSAQDILISRDGDWHSGGFTKTPEKILSQVDVVFNALHGGYGEDGKVQSILRTLGKPHTGSETLPSAISMNKHLTKNVYRLHGIKTPVSIVLQPKDNTHRRIVEIFQTFPQPAIVKPLSGGSSQSIAVVQDFLSFEKAIEQAFRHSGAVLVEEYIVGLEATCGTLDNEDATQIEALLPVAVFPNNKKAFFDYDSKYEGEESLVDTTTRYFTNDQLSEIQRLATLAHIALDLRQYSRSDFIVTKNRGIYILETNSLPALLPNALYTKSLEASNIDFKDFLSRIIGRAVVYG